ncbi:hypothetical protein LCGC14_2397680 [marine sediment metagenome]|uniref:Uncharacterized protein n=1 Tax=marine sediment metagenome TaxID=412755 RepID=A0A0F9EQS7_9ZZZZ
MGPAAPLRIIVTMASRREKVIAALREKAAALDQKLGPPSTAPQVQWVDPATFARTASATDTLTPRAAAPPAPTTPAKSAQAPTKPKANVAKKRLDRWNPLNLRR